MNALRMWVVVCLVHCTGLVAYAQTPDARSVPAGANATWEVALSLVSIEQQDGLVFRGPVGPTYLNSLLVNAPLSNDHFIRMSAERVDYEMEILGEEEYEMASVDGFSLSAGFEKRWRTEKRVDFMAGGGIFFERTMMRGEGALFTAGFPGEFPIDHTRNYMGVSPFAGIMIDLSRKWFVRIETSFRVGIVRTHNHTGVYIDPFDVYTTATIRPLSFVGVGCKI